MGAAITHRTRRAILEAVRAQALEPVNPDLEPIVLTAADESELQVIAELVEALRG